VKDIKVIKMEDKKVKRMSNEALAEEIKSYIDIKTNDLKEELLKEIDVKLDKTQYRIYKGLQTSLGHKIESHSNGIVRLINKVLDRVDELKQ